VATDVRPSVEDPAARFAGAWEEFVVALRRAQLRGPQTRDDLRLSQYYLLRPLGDRGPLTVGQLAEAAGIAAPTVTRVVDGLEDAGLVRRTRSRSDRRAVRISLTATGRTRLKRKSELIARQRLRLYESLEPDEREQSERVLRHLAQLIGEL
jgi:DNA-binding MarR family transcriptional regulator